MYSLYSLCLDFCSRHSDFQIIYAANGLKLWGVYKFNIYNEILDKTLSGGFNLSINVDFNYPNVVPIVKETDSRIPKSFHMNNDTLCLGVDEEMLLSIKSMTLTQFLETYINSYLFAYSYYEIYGIIPFTDRSHGTDGIREFYIEYFEVSSVNEVRFLLGIMISSLPIPKNHFCPCGSKKKYKDCHKEKFDKLLSIHNYSYYRELLRRL